MQYDIRPMVAADAEASRRLGHEAFGLPDQPEKKPATLETEARTWLGAYDGETLVGQVLALDHESAFGGAWLPSLGIAGVTIANERRGAGLLRPMFTHLLSEARAHGVAVSTLYPSASAIYRGLGYEVVAEVGSVVVASATMSRVSADESVRLRRATEDDVPALIEGYHAWALEQNGPLAHRGPLFETRPKKWLKQFTGVSVAVDAEGAVVGHLAWNRGTWTTQQLVVEQFIWRTGAAGRSLLAMLASNSSVVESVRFASSGVEPLRLLLPASRWKVEADEPYMLRLVDLRAALQGRVWPDGVELELPFRVHGDLLEANNGDWKLRIEDGQALLTRIGRAGSHSKRSVPLELTPRGLAALYAGAHCASTLRTLGLIDGGNPALDAAWSLAFGGRQVHITDHF